MYRFFKYEWKIKYKTFFEKEWKKRAQHNPFFCDKTNLFILTFLTCTLIKLQNSLLKALRFIFPFLGGLTLPKLIEKEKSNIWCFFTDPNKCWFCLAGRIFLVQFGVLLYIKCEGGREVLWKYANVWFYLIGLDVEVTTHWLPLGKEGLMSSYI